jgi:hypothetical protein
MYVGFWETMRDEAHLHRPLWETAPTFPAETKTNRTHCDVEPAPSLFVIADSMCRLHRIATHFPSWYANKDRLQEENLIVQCSSPRNYAGVNVSHEGQNKTDTYEMSTSLRECRWSMHV